MENGASVTWEVYEARNRFQMYNELMTLYVLVLLFL